MPRVLQLEDKTNITIETEPFGSGGSGEVFRILSPSYFTSQVVKLYYKERLTKEAENKIRYLVSKEINQGEHESIVWIKNVVLDNGKFAGFTMNYADGIGLEQFLNDRWWRKNDTRDWDKYKLENEKGIENRIRLCLNIAIAINIIHKNSNYTIADIKPSNFKFYKNGLVSIIDIDNIEVIEDGKVLYRAQVISPEYSPPEFHNGLDYRKTSASQKWDRYSLSILFYHILCGIHPFQFVKYRKSGEEYTDTRMIAEGLFLFGNKSDYLEPVKPQHKNFLNLNNEVKSLFIQCFDKEHDKPQLRPSAEDWCRVLSYNKSAIKRLSITEHFNSDATYNTRLKDALNLNVYSSPLTLKNNIEISFPEVKFHNLSNSLKIFDKVLNFFKKSSRQVLIDELKVIERGIKNILEKEPNLKNEIAVIILEFESKQEEIKSDEKSEIDKLKKELQLVLNDAEYLVTKAKEEEAKEISEMQNQIKSLIYKEDNSLAMSHSYIYGDLINNFEKKRLDYQVSIHNYDVDKRNEIEKLVSEKSKLSKYNIEKECINIFNQNLPSVIAVLKQFNFITAADFSKVSIDGCLLNNSNKWIKIAGMGAERAKKLLYWRNTIENNENAKIRQNVNLKYNKLQAELLSIWSITEKNHRLTITPLDVKFKSREAEIKRNKARLNETKEEEEKKIKVKYDELHTDLKSEFITSLDKFYDDIDKIHLHTRNALTNNLSFMKIN